VRGSYLRVRSDPSFSPRFAPISWQRAVRGTPASSPRLRPHVRKDWRYQLDYLHDPLPQRDFRPAGTRSQIRRAGDGVSWTRKIRWQCGGEEAQRRTFLPRRDDPASVLGKMRKRIQPELATARSHNTTSSTHSDAPTSRVTRAYAVTIVIETYTPGRRSGIQRHRLWIEANTSSISRPYTGQVRLSALVSLWRLISWQTSGRR